MRLTALILAAVAIGLPSVAGAAVFVYGGTLSGSAESPPNASPGTGTVLVTFDNVAHTLRVQSSFSGLTSPTTQAHIHAATAAPLTGTAIVATTLPNFPGFPLGVTFGVYDAIFNTLAATTYNPAFVMANGGTPATAETALAGALAQGTSYFNIHTSAFPGGEIRAFLTSTSVPEPAGWTTMIAGFGLAGAALRGSRAPSRRPATT